MHVIVIILAIIGAFAVLPVIIGLISVLSVPVILVVSCIIIPVMIGMMLGGKFQITIHKRGEDDKE